MRPARAWVLISLLLVAIAFSACGGEDDGGSTGSNAQQDPADLEGKSWILTQMTTVGGQTEIVDVGVSAEFDGTTIGGNSGCNQYNASYEAEGSRISFGPIAGTAMACEEPQSSTEARYLQLLGEVGSFRISGRSMSMSDQSGTPVLQFMTG